MKRTNYALRFSLSLSICILFPVITIMYVIIIIGSLMYGELVQNEIYKVLLTALLSYGLCFIVTLIIGFILYKITDFKINKRENLTLSNGTNEIRIKDIDRIKARRFLFMYSFDIYAKPFKSFASMSFYFNNKNELIDFINENKEHLYEYIRKSDLEKLGL